MLYFSSLSSINFHEKRASDDKGARNYILCFGKSGIKFAALNHMLGHVKINISAEPSAPCWALLFLPRSQSSCINQYSRDRTKTKPKAQIYLFVSSVISVLNCTASIPASSLIYIIFFDRKFQKNIKLRLFFLKFYEPNIYECSFLPSFCYELYFLKKKYVTYPKSATTALWN
jgi:hypothetical protein